MRITRCEQIRVISTSDPSEFQEQVNAAMVELKRLDPKLTIRDGPNFTAIIIYEKETRICETAKDEVKAEGFTYLCADCPHADQPSDRVKWAYCRYAVAGKTHIEQEACEMFYNELRTGRIEPVRR